MSEEENQYLIYGTADGSDTVYDRKLEAQYHSLYGAVGEARHIFIEAGLSYFHSLHPKRKTFSVLEIGFGTGLNAFLSWQYALRWQLQLCYSGIDPMPLSTRICRRLNYAAWVPEVEFMALHESVHDSSFRELSPFFLLQRSTQSWPQEVPTKAHTLDIVFYDPFAPSVVPELWNKKALSTLLDILAKGGILVTYSVQSNLQHTLRDLGFRLEILPGPQGKKHILRAHAP